MAGLLLARGQGRLSEMAAPSALGASRLRRVRQLLTVSVVLTVTAGARGIALAYLLQGLLLRLLPIDHPGVPRPAVDGGVLLFALGFSVASGPLIAIVPALGGVVVDPARALRSRPRASKVRNASYFTPARWSNLRLTGSSVNHSLYWAASSGVTR